MSTQTNTADLASHALATLAAALEAGNSAALTAYLKVTAKFHKYSWTNCLLIATHETPSREYMCPDCHRRIVLDWGRKPEPVTGLAEGELLASEDAA